MSAPAILMVRKILEINEKDAAELLNLDSKSYLFKEQGSDSFEWHEIVKLWDWFTSRMELLPKKKQKDMQLIREYFPLKLKDTNSIQGNLFDSELPPGITGTTQLKVPLHFTELPENDTIIDPWGDVNLKIADRIKNTNFFSPYPAFDFHGIVWWHEEIGYWAIQISQLSAYRETLIGEYLDELVKATRDRYGNR